MGLPGLLVHQVVLCGGPSGTSSIAIGIDRLVDQSRSVWILSEAGVLALCDECLAEVFSFWVPLDVRHAFWWVAQLLDNFVESALLIGVAECV